MQLAVFIADGGGSSTTATVEIKLRQTNDFPPQLAPPASRDVCTGRDSHTGLFLTALDLDMPPHAEPFSFKLVDHSASNWTIQRVNGEDWALITQPWGVLTKSISVLVTETQLSFSW